MKTVNHWIGGKTVEGASGNWGPVTDPATGAVTTQVALASAEEVGAAVSRGEGGVRDLGHVLAVAAHRDPVPLPRAAGRPPRRHRRTDHRRARQGPLRRAGRGRPRSGDRGTRLRDHHTAQGRTVHPGLQPGRRRRDPPAARRRRGHHAVQLPGDGADVDVPAGDRLRKHLRAQAEREGPLGGHAAGRARRGGRPARRRAQRRPRRQGRGRRAAGPPGRQRGLVRRLDPHRPLHPRHGLRQRQARPGARRREEPHAGPAGRRPGRGGGRRRLGRVRLGG